MGTNEGPLGIYRLDSVSVWDARVSVISVVFVHLFSGFRRPGDLHWHIEHHDWAHGIECFCLSIDLCLQKEEGDLLDPKRIQWWKERIHARQVMGIGGAPVRDLDSSTMVRGGSPPFERSSSSMGAPLAISQAPSSGSSRYRAFASRCRANDAVCWAWRMWIHRAPSNADMALPYAVSLHLEVAHD